MEPRTLGALAEIVATDETPRLRRLGLVPTSRQIRAELLGRGHEAEGVPSGVGIDPPGPWAGIQYLGQRAGTRDLNRKASVTQVVNEKVEVHVLLSALARPRGRPITSHTVK
jgi:hypothetical protein